MYVDEKSDVPVQGRRQPRRIPSHEAEGLSLRLVMEARHVWGHFTAAELREKRGLPKVPAMDAVFRQHDMYESATLVSRHAAA
jgi:hypothetical protein